MKGKLKLFRNIWMCAGLLFTAWIFYSMQAQGIDEAFLLNDNKTKVSDCENYISFSPVQAYQNVLIFYPGALVGPQAYVPLCRRIANHGIKAIIIKMPFRLASLGYKKPKELGLFDDKSKKYILAGHSQGGKMAAQFVKENPLLVGKLILLGTTHPKNFSLGETPVKVLKIFGSRDGVAQSDDVNSNRNLLPATTKFVEIVGGNHSQFGYYGFQIGDKIATISRYDQQDLIVNEMLAFIANR